MSTRLATSRIFLIFTAALGMSLLPAEVRAGQPLDSASIISCGSLELFLGSVQIFDATRTQVIDTAPGRKIQCGDWISVEDGKAVIRHRDGFQIQIGAQSFVQVLDPQSGANQDHDHLALFRGQVEVNAPASVEVRLATANASVVFRGSDGIVLFNGERHETQLVGLEGEPRIANRHLPKDAARVKPGRFSVVAPNENRLQPSVPRAADPKQLSELLARFGVSPALRGKVLAAAKQAAETRLPKKLATKKTSATRAPASVPATAASQAFVPVQGSDLPGVTGSSREIEPPVKRAPTRARAVASTKAEPDWTKAPSREATEKEKKRLLQKLSGLQPEAEDMEE